MARPQKRIIWKKNLDTQSTEVKKLRPVVRVVPRNDELVLIPGQLFRLNVPLEPIPVHPREQPPQFPYIAKSWYATPMPYVVGYLPQGSLAVFLGHTRIEELEGTQTRSLLRATFFINGARYMPVDLNFFDVVS